MARRRRAFSARAIFAALSFTQAAFGADVGVVANDPSDPFATRLVAELEQLGFSVAREKALAATSREAVIVRVSDQDLELYEVSRDGSLRRRSMTAARTDPLKAAEEVRAIMLPLVERPPAPEPPPPPRAPEPPPAGDGPRVEPAPSPAPKIGELTLGGSAFFGGAKPGVAVAVSAAVFPRSLRSRRASLGVGAGGVIEAVSESVSAAQGSADVRAMLFGPEIIGRLELSPRVVADLAVGAWASHLRVAGNANAPFTSRDDSAWTWSPTARVRLAHAIGALALFAEARSGISMPGVAIRFDGGTVREWGRPWGSLGAGVAFAF